MIFVCTCLGKYFSQCKTNTNEFDECIKNAINNVRPYFTTGRFCFTCINKYFVNIFYNIF